MDDHGTCLSRIHPPSYFVICWVWFWFDFSISKFINIYQIIYIYIKNNQVIYASLKMHSVQGRIRGGPGGTAPPPWET